MSTSEVDSTKDLEKKPSQRRINKPLIEKRRRARINDSLAQLKSIVLEASGAKDGRPSKLEKADILEMTVDFIKKKTVPSTHAAKYINNSAAPEDIREEYSAGYAKCLTEISKFLEDTPFVDDASRKLVEHISQKFKQVGGPENDNQNDTEVINGKIRIEPLKQFVHSDNAEKTKDPIDLSMCGKKTDRIESSGTANLTLPAERPMSTSNPNHVVGQQVPVGFVCGNHIMLLLQLPSQQQNQQQLVSQNVMSLNHQLQAVSGTTAFATIPHNHGLSSLDTKTVSWPVELPPLVSSATLHNQNNIILVPSSHKTSDITSIKTDTDSALSNAVNPVLDQNQQISNSNHWRPW